MHNYIKIIGGKWKGTKIHVLDLPGLRPTANRGRETIFNWLQNHIHDSNCLDLFAGTGALGFEAISRGAGHVTFVENNKETVNNLIRTKEKLKASNCQIEHSDAIKFIQKTDKKFDIVFIDPPYDFKNLKDTVETICKSQCIHNNTLVVTEWSKQNPLNITYLTKVKSGNFGVAQINIWEARTKNDSN